VSSTPAAILPTCWLESRATHSPDQIAVTFDDDHAVADAGLILAASLAGGLGLRELFDTQVDLGEMAAELWLQVEVVGCPTVCRHRAVQPDRPTGVN
jgi:hypothetical protein